MNVKGISYGAATGLICHISNNYTDYQVMVCSEDEKECWLNNPYFNANIAVMGEELDNPKRIYVDCLNRLELSSIESEGATDIVVFEFHHNMNELDKRQAFTDKDITDFDTTIHNYVEANKQASLTRITDKTGN